MVKFIRSPRGFTEFEFLGLVVAGVLLAALLAHFMFEQSIQVERLNALVWRDQIRLSVEGQISNLDVLKKSIEALPENAENASLRACALNKATLKSCDGPACCHSRLSRPLAILSLGEDSKLIAGLPERPSCLDEKGIPTPLESDKCFASVAVSVEPLCAEGKDRCGHAFAWLVHYEIQYRNKFITKNAGGTSDSRDASDARDASVLRRTLSIVSEGVRPSQ